ncbi:MAG: UDP-N-acetylmuramoyl-tripeptide--D-alanyl-D-alanine ligase [Chloroflexi bacterium]|nr:UDP-N-acetylmuramoyl-tripeptide--D-alanyl-D-alanine ligase [Chloroflexota bacterium]
MVYGDVIRALGSHLLEVREPRAESGDFGEVVIDTRRMKPGDLFVALKGGRGDGHDYLGAALAAGAGAALAERVPDGLTCAAPVFVVSDSLRALQALAAYWRDRHPARVIGVTGSVGKTSAKDLIADLLATRYTVLRNEGNLNNEIGLPLTLLKLSEKHDRAIVEMGMYDLGEIATLCVIARPSIGVVTNIGPSHLERLGSLERIAQAKGELVEALPADGWAVLNGDDERVLALAGRTRAHVIFYGLGTDNDVRAEDIESLGLGGVRFTLRSEGLAVSVEMAVPGRHNVYGALAAAAVARIEGLSLEEIGAGLRGIKGQAHLMVLAGVNGSTIIDDTYNASPVSAKAALDLLAELPGRKIAVLGDMLELGSYAEEGHRDVGRRAAQVADMLVAVGELGRIIGEEAASGGLVKVIFAGTNEEASEWLLSALELGDKVLVKGSRGVRMEQIVDRIKR